jgi:electron transfer flavoprotein-quinone oxidoreductase
LAKYDVIVVGAGPGGTTAAKVAADKKLKVLLLERARTPGDKNMSGSYLFRNVCEDLFPGFQKADFHKGQVRTGGIDFRWSLDDDEKRYGISISPGGEPFRDMMTVFRPESDAWFANEAVKAGAELKTALATDVIWAKGEDQRVVGVVTDRGNFEAPVVIDASGIHSMIARRTGLVTWTGAKAQDKIMLAIKYIYHVDEKVLRERLQTYFDSDGVEVDWGAMPTMAGATAAYWGSHAVGIPGRGIVNIIVYHTLREMVERRVNVHQRMQWYLNQDPVKKLLEGGEFVYCNFHCLNAGDIVGQPPKAQLPGLMLAGDSGGFGNPLDDFGANVAMTMGKMAAELAVEMKKKGDYSTEMFAKYDANWRNSFIAEDNIPEIALLMRGDGFTKMLGTMDDAICTFFTKRFNNTSYPQIMLTIMPKMIGVLPTLTDAAYAMKPIAKVGVKKMAPLMALFGGDTVAKPEGAQEK